MFEGQYHKQAPEVEALLEAGRELMKSTPPLQWGPMIRAMRAFTQCTTMSIPVEPVQQAPQGKIVTIVDEVY